MWDTNPDGAEASRSFDRQAQGDFEPVAGNLDTNGIQSGYNPHKPAEITSPDYPKAID